MIKTKYKQNLLTVMIGVGLLLSGCGNHNYVETKKAQSPASVPMETMSKESSNTKPVTITTEKEQGKESQTSTDNADEQPAAKRASSILRTYKEGNVTIQYPEISNTDYPDIEERINEQLRTNALYIMNAYEVDPDKDNLSINCDVISIDRNRITAVYQGLYYAKEAAYPNNIYFTNSVDFSSVKNLRLNDYVDPKVVVEAILSGDYQFLSATPEIEEALKSYLQETNKETLTRILQKADFTNASTSDSDLSLFPESFSYEDKGSIIVSISVPHALGDFAVISYSPETK
ncbi:hypothetical protein [Clostridium sp. E02]|uniref:hypothetical protein n=1 Tax=Clostridium sp. E02 TaxID=2487134 RepID=UPI000F525B64|nr:hypothetical protein [Clostridium sp. E02]